MAYTIAFFSDTHVGYATRCRSHPASGLNMRVRDGYLGLRETVDQIIETSPDVVVHGGDLFHRSQPNIGDIAWVRRQLERFYKAGIPVIANTGNHDFSNDRSKLPATAAVNDPDRQIFMVTEPYKLLTPVDGLNIHMVSHVGLIAKQRVVPEPVDGEVNLFVSHGAAQVPGHPIFACVDSPGEAVIGHDVLTLPWNGSLLGHYHGMNPLPGFDKGDTGQVWYAGSLLRRGFSDPPGIRGWLLVTIHDDGTVTYERKAVRQRTQHDLGVIDATGLTGSEVEEAIRLNLNSVDISDAIIRQRVINCTLPVRRGVDMAAINNIASSALTWQLEFLRPQEQEYMELKEEEKSITSLKTAGSSDLPTMWSHWFTQWADTTNLPDQYRSHVSEKGSELLGGVKNDIMESTE